MFVRHQVSKEFVIINIVDLIAIQSGTNLMDNYPQNCTTLAFVGILDGFQNDLYTSYVGGLINCVGVQNGSTFRDNIRLLV